MNFFIYFLFFAYFTTGFQVTNISSYPVTLIDFAFVGIIITFFIKLLWEGKTLRISANPVHLFIALFVVAGLLSAIAPIYTGRYDFLFQFVKTFTHLLYLVFFAFICIAYPIKMNTWTRVVQLWLILSLIINVFGFYQIVARAYGLPLAWIDYTNIGLLGRGEQTAESYRQLSLNFGGFFRATSIFTEPSALAWFNVYIQIFLVIPFVQKRKPFFKSRLFNLTLFICSILALFMAFSLTGFLGMAMLIGGIILFEKNKRLLYFAFIFLIASVSVLIMDDYIESYAGVSVIELFESRISGIIGSGSGGVEGESYFTRLENFKKSVVVWEKYPLTGIGLGNIHNNKEILITYSDSSFLAALSEAGILGALSFIGIFLFLAIVTLKYVLNRKKLEALSEENRRMAGISFYITLLLIMLNFFTSNSAVKYTLWVNLGMLLSIITILDIKMGVKYAVIDFFGQGMRDYLKKGLAAYSEKRNKAAS